MLVSDAPLVYEFVTIETSVWFFSTNTIDESFPMGMSVDVGQGLVDVSEGVDRIRMRGEEIF